MAKGLVTSIRGSGELGVAVHSLLAVCYFTGGDVANEIDGLAFEIKFQLPDIYTLADLKSAMIQAVLDKAAELGLTVASTDIDIPSYESGI